MKNYINSHIMNKKLLNLIFAGIFLLLIISSAHAITGQVTRKFYLNEQKININSQAAEGINSFQKTVKVYNEKGDLLGVNPKDIEALKTTSDVFNLNIQPTEAFSIQGITIEGISKENIDKDLVILSDIPSINTAFTNFDVLSSSAPLTDFKNMKLDYGYVCAGPRYKIYKCKDWDYVKGLCRNDTSWVAIKVLNKGLQRVILTLEPEDPGIGIGPDPYGTVCGDSFCEGESFGETCYNCISDCGICVAEKKFSFWSWLLDWLTGAVIVETPAGQVTRIFDEDTSQDYNANIPENVSESNESLKYDENGSCIEIWECDFWGPYNSEGFRVRDCRDKNACGTEITLPPTEEKCQWMEEEPIIVPREYKLKWERVLILIIILIVVLYFILVIYRIIREIFRKIQGRRKHVLRKRKDRFEALRDKLDALSKQTMYTNNLGGVLDNLSDIVKSTLLALLGTKENLSFLELSHLLKSGSLRPSQREKALDLIREMELVRFSGQNLNKETVLTLIGRAKLLIPREVHEHKTGV